MYLLVEPALSLESWIKCVLTVHSSGAVRPTVRLLTPLFGLRLPGDGEADTRTPRRDHLVTVRARARARVTVTVTISVRSRILLSAKIPSFVRSLGLGLGLGSEFEGRNGRL